MFNSYFSARYILSKNALTSLVFSDRSDGKSFDCKLRALEDYEKDKSITIYMRRYKSEITDKLYNSFFDEVLKVEKYSKYNDWIFKGSKTGVQVKTSISGKWDWIIYFVPLSMSGKLKSQLSEVLRVKTIDFDEYIPLDGRYLKDEPNILMEFYKTIDRDRDIVQLLILGNKITPFNPMFDYFNIDLRIDKDKVRLYQENTVAVQIYSNAEHREKREQGRFRKMVKGTSYEDYDTGGVLNALNIKIKQRTGFDYLCSFKTERGEGSIWYNSGRMVISEYLRDDGYILTDKVYNLTRKSYQCTFGKFPQNLKLIYKRGDMFFESDKAFYKFEKILTKIGSV